MIVDFCVKRLLLSYIKETEKRCQSNVKIGRLLHEHNLLMG